MPTSHNKSILIGIFFLVFAFICVMASFYLMGDLHTQAEADIKDLNEQLTIAEIERSNTLTELKDVRSRLNTIDLDHMVRQAQRVTKSSEFRRKEGLLWADPESATYVITLGALNGLKSGNYLEVYDENKMIGRIVVETPLDVISYVHPLEKFIKDADKKYYRVLIE